MSVFLDRLMERVKAAEGPAAKVHALVEAVSEELTAQKDDGTPITITGDVAADLAEGKAEIVAAVVEASGTGADASASTSGQAAGEHSPESA